ncbi:MAG: hypothetical protein JEZ09_04640 [Salinivirgaceae bacterium]|nr:hypothetical protein [Salinivirgaceae bacterium]
MKHLIVFASILHFFFPINVQSQTLLEKEYNDAYQMAVKNEGSLSLKYSFIALEKAIELNNPNYIANSYLEICFDYDEIGNYTNALNYALKSASEYEKLNNKKGLAASYSILGNIYAHISNYNLAIEYFKKSNLLREHKDSILIEQVKLNIGDAYRQMHKYDSALYYFNQTLAAFLKYNDSIGIAYCYCNLGLVYLNLNEQVIGDSILNKSFELLKHLEDYLPIVIATFEKAELEFNRGHLLEAKKLALDANSLAIKFNFKTEIRDILSLLSKIAEKNNDYKNAFNYLSDYQEYKDSLVNDKVVSQMAEMRAEFEISQNEVEMTYLKRINNARANLLIIAGIGLLAIVILSIFLYIRNKQRKEANKKLSEFNEELQQKNYIIHNQLEEKGILMKEIHHRVKNNLQIISSIINLQSMRIDNKETIEIFDEMQRRIMAISSIHQKLYQSDSVSIINMKDYLGEVVDATHSAFNNKDLNVSYQIAIQNVNLNIDAAVSIGLIVNELTTNAYKYAFSADKENHLLISLSHDGNSTCKLLIHDNGPGIPEGKDIFKSNSLGLRMVSLLTRQMKGEISAENKDGTIFSITFTDIKNKLT